MFNLFKILFFFLMILGSLIAISSYSWMSMWMGLEINLLSIIPLLSDSKNSFPSESALKYFLTQALASSILLLSIIINLNFFNYFTQINTISSILMNSALLIKIGAAPFHAWFPEVLEGLNWFNSTILLTWQKIAPMILIFYNSKLPLFFLSIILISTIISGVLGLNQVSLRKILAYSSINHVSWMLASMLNSQNIWFFYFVIYSIINMNLIFIFYKFNIYTLNQLFSSLNSSKLMKMIFLLNFFSLGGLPPFLGFFPKWLVVNNLIQNNFFLLSTLLIIFTLITLFFYLRITFSTFMINTNEVLIFIPQSLNFSVIFFNIISLMGLLACTLIFNHL